jgi:hypothetical protein
MEAAMETRTARGACRACRAVEILLGWTWIAGFVVSVDLLAAALLGRRHWTDVILALAVVLLAYWLCRRAGLVGDRLETRSGGALQPPVALR